MPTETFSVRLLSGKEREVTVHYLVRSSRPPAWLATVQHERTEAPQEVRVTAARLFESLAQFRVNGLDRTLKFDAMVKVPSRFGQADALADYYSEICKVDLTSHLSSTGKFRSEHGAALSDRVGQLSYRPTGSEGTFDRILIVDESLNTGGSLASVIEVLMSHGVPSSCSFSLACYWWVLPSVALVVEVPR